MTAWERVYLGGKYWAHTGECSEVQIGDHIHYGENVIVGADRAMVPELVLRDYRVIFSDPSKAQPTGTIPYP